MIRILLISLLLSGCAAVPNNGGYKWGCGTKSNTTYGVTSNTTKTISLIDYGTEIQSPWVKHNGN